MSRLFYMIAALVAAAASSVNAEPVTIVSWNMSPESPETFEDRRDNIAALDADLAPDILVLIETTGEDGARRIVDALGWDRYFAIASDFGSHPTNAFFALETAVISKFPIERVVEFDASPDGAGTVFSSDDGFDAPVAEVELSSSGIAGFPETVAKSDRGTLRVDIEGGLSIFPVHLKSNRNGACIDLVTARRLLRAADIEVPAEIDTFLASGFPRATGEHIRNAQKRERVMAATIRVAEEALLEGRVPVIAGDYNTAFEPGKAGTDIGEDCILSDFSCDKAPFPAAACEGDGFDDTLALLENGLIGPTRWTVLSRDLPRTFNDPAFADLAIDHFAVPEDAAEEFEDAERADRTYGSDHFPIRIMFQD